MISVPPLPPKVDGWGGPGWRCAVFGAPPWRCGRLELRSCRAHAKVEGLADDLGESVVGAWDVVQGGASGGGVVA